MKNWKNRKRIHWDGNTKCIRLTEHYSIGFDIYSFKNFFHTLFGHKTHGQLVKGWQGGSLFWKTLSLKKKIFDKHYGLSKFFTLYYGYEERPYHGINWYHLQISFLPFVLNYYFDEKEDEGCLDMCMN